MSEVISANNASTEVARPAHASLADSYEQDLNDADVAAEAARQNAIEAVDAQLAKQGEPGAVPAAKAGPSTSKFSELHAKLSNAAAIVEHVRATYGTLSTSPKEFHGFLQAIANRDAKIYDQLFHFHRAETLWVLDRIASAGGASHNRTHAKQHAKPKPGKKPVVRPAAAVTGADSSSPYALEFVIRCECGAPGQEGDYQNESKNIIAISDSAPLPVLTARELIADVFSRDPAAYFERQLQLVQSPDDVTAAAVRLLALARSSARDGVRAVNDAFTLFEASDATAAALIGAPKATLQLGHLLAKARRFLPAAPKADDATAAAPAAAAEEPAAASPPAAGVTEMVTAVLKAAHTLCTGKGAIEVPTKAQHFIDHAMTTGLVGEDEVAWVEELLAAVTGGVETQADSMTSVLTIKTANTRAELRQAFEAVSDVGTNPESPVIAKPTPDVLSALGTAGVTLRAALKASPSADGEQLCKQITAALVNCTTATGTALPRRAAKFVEDERRIERQADQKRPRIADAEGLPEAVPRPQPRRAVGFTE